MSDPIIDVIKHPDRYNNSIKQFEVLTGLKISDYPSILDFIYAAYKKARTDTLTAMFAMKMKDDETFDEYRRRYELMDQVNIIRYYYERIIVFQWIID